MKIKKFKGKIRITAKKLNLILLYKSCDYDEDILEDILDIFFDFNFFKDLMNDLYTTNFYDFIKPYLKRITSLLFSIKDEEIKKLTLEETKTLYNCKNINYDKPITFQYFKEVMLNTLPLAKLALLYAELLVYMGDIKEAFQAPLIFYANFDIKKFLLHYLNLYFSDTLNYGTKSEILAFIKDEPSLYKIWGKCKESIYDYWFWILMYQTFDYFLKNQLKNISKASKVFSWETFKAGENKPCLYQEDEEQLKEIENIKSQNRSKNKTAHNAYSSKEYLTIYNGKKAYKTIQNMYKFAKFITKCIYKNVNYKSAYTNMEKLALDSEYQAFVTGLNFIYSCNHNCSSCQYRKNSLCTNTNTNNMLDNFKEFANKHLTIIYNKLFEENKDIMDIYNFLEKTSKQDFALTILKSIYPFFENKTNKTILNIFSNFNEITDENEYFETYKNAFYEQHQDIFYRTESIIFALHTISEALEMFLKNPSPDKRVFIMMNIKQIEMLLPF